MKTKLNKTELRAEIAELDRVYDIYNNAKHAYPRTEKQVYLEAKKDFESLLGRIEMKYDLPIREIRMLLMNKSFQKFMQKFTACTCLLVVLMFSACGSRVASKEAQNATEASKTVVAQSKADSHLCGFGLKDGRKCSRKVSNQHGAGALCFQHRGK